jgi:uncharacterized protein (DUF2249 family)
MSTVTLATSSADVDAVTAVEQHHAQLAGALTTMVDRLVTAAASHADDPADRARRELVGWCRRELLPHARAEEEAMYPAAHRRADARLLVSGMLAEHEVLAGLVDQLDAATDPVRAAAAGTALSVLFASHLDKENDLLLPVLAADPEVSLAELLAGMHELLGGGAEDRAGDEAGEGHGAHGCGCGEDTVDADPELDARVVPHAIRHSTIFGALDAVTPGSALILLAPHDPIPLLAQVEQRHPGVFAVEYLERGPETWRLRFRRRAH